MVQFKYWCLRLILCLASKGTGVYRNRIVFNFKKCVHIKCVTLIVCNSLYLHLKKQLQLLPNY